MDKHNGFEYGVVWAGVTRSKNGIETTDGDLAWRIKLFFKRLHWSKTDFSVQTFISNGTVWFVSDEQNVTIDRELMQLLDYIASRKALELIPSGIKEEG